MQALGSHTPVIAHIVLLAITSLTLLAPNQAHGDGLDAPVPVAPYFNGVFPSITPSTATGWTTENAFPNLVWNDALWMTPYPGTNHLIVSDRIGRIYRFENRPDVTPEEMDLLLDWRTQTELSVDQGFYSVAFHPEFRQPGSPNRGYLYVCYSHRYLPGVNNDDATYWRITRFTMPDGPGAIPDENSLIDPASEMVLISQFDPHRWHNGGPLFFGPDGFLYACNGDGGGASDPFLYSQNVDIGFFGGVLRIDVDSDPTKSHPIRRQPLDTDRPVDWEPSYSQNYYIPNNNPLVDPGILPEDPALVLEEFYAIGLRSPHTMHLDPTTGQVWIGDVGQNSREEFDVFTVPLQGEEPPAEPINFQWAYREGTWTGPRTKPDPLIGLDGASIHSYGRTVGRCIIGGFAYRGTQFDAELGGKVLFGDHMTGRLWALTQVESGPPIVEELLSGFRTGQKSGLGNICRDAAGEVYFMDLNGPAHVGGIIRRLVQTTSPSPPDLLSELGIFSNLTTLEPSSALVPYDIASPLYSDNAIKKRWMALPNDGAHDLPSEKIVFGTIDDWVFPPGTVFVKHFELPIDELDPSQTARLETRFLVCTDSGEKYGVTYRWLPDGSDAYLIDGAETGTYSIAEQGGENRDQIWQFPGRGDCLLCHSSASGQALGVRAHQLNSPLTYPATGRTANQLHTWSDLGMFDTTLSETELKGFLRAHPLDDERVPREHRVRSYLDANCSHCHRPGAVGGTFDARLTTSLASQNIVNGPLERTFRLGPDDAVVRPADISMSALHHRMNHSNPDPTSMPPLAYNLVNQSVVAEVELWINSLVPAEFEPTGPRPVRTLIAGPTEPRSGPTEVSIIFDHDVSGFSPDDISITNGQVTELSGSGYYYRALVEGFGGIMSLTVPNGIVINSTGQGNLMSNTVNLTHDSLLTDWALTYGLSGAATTHSADTDGDQMVNLLEFLFNMNPSSQDLHTYDPTAPLETYGPSGLPLVEFDVSPEGNPVLRIIFIRRKAAVAQGYLYQIELTNTLLPNAENWQTSNAITNVESINTDWERVTIEESEPINETPARFVRSRVTFPAD